MASGILITGPHKGHYVQISQDDSGSGWHIWVTDREPGSPAGPGEGWDIWADDEDQVQEWLRDPDFQVRWLDSE